MTFIRTGRRPGTISLGILTQARIQSTDLSVVVSLALEIYNEPSFPSQ